MGVKVVWKLPLTSGVSEVHANKCKRISVGWKLVDSNKTLFVTRSRQGCSKNFLHRSPYEYKSGGLHLRCYEVVCARYVNPQLAVVFI
jgi:hypothetical protein